MRILMILIDSPSFVPRFINAKYLERQQRQDQFYS